MKEFCDIIERELGVFLDSSKDYLVKTRLDHLITRHEQGSLDNLIVTFRKGTNMRLNREVMEALLTHETYFFREPKHFDFIVTTLLTQMLSVPGNQSINFWCCACSTGQEPYSLMMKILETFPETVFQRIKIWATDVCATCVEYAKTGEYSKNEISRGLSSMHLEKYFKKNGDKYILQDKYRSLVKFKDHNLLSRMPFCELQFDVVLMRNVLIYFRDQVKEQVLNNVSALMKPGCHLLLSSTENTRPIQQFRSYVPDELRQSVMVKNSGLSATADKKIIVVA